jgi:hypothetical protein
MFFSVLKDSFTFPYLLQSFAFQLKKKLAEKTQTSTTLEGDLRWESYFGACDVVRPLLATK